MTDMEMDVDMAEYTTHEVVYGDHEHHGAEKCGPHRTLKKSSLRRARTPPIFSKRKKVSFDSCALQAPASGGSGRRTRSLSPPNQRKPSLKQEKQDDQANTEWPNSEASSSYPESSRVTYEYDGDMAME